MRGKAGRGGESQHPWLAAPQCGQPLYKNWCNATSMRQLAASEGVTQGEGRRQGLPRCFAAAADSSPPRPQQPVSSSRHCRCRYPHCPRRCCCCQVCALRGSPAPEPPAPVAAPCPPGSPASRPAPRPPAWPLHSATASRADTKVTGVQEPLFVWIARTARLPATLPLAWLRRKAGPSLLLPLAPLSHPPAKRTALTFYPPKVLLQHRQPGRLRPLDILRSGLRGTSTGNCRSAQHEPALE